MASIWFIFNLILSAKYILIIFDNHLVFTNKKLVKILIIVYEKDFLLCLKIVK